MAELLDVDQPVRKRNVLVPIGPVPDGRSSEARRQREIRGFLDKLKKANEEQEARRLLQTGREARLGPTATTGRMPPITPQPRPAAEWAKPEWQALQRTRPPAPEEPLPESFPDVGLAAAGQTAWQLGKGTLGLGVGLAKGLLEPPARAALRMMEIDPKFKGLAERTLGPETPREMPRLRADAQGRVLPPLIGAKSFADVMNDLEILGTAMPPTAEGAALINAALREAVPQAKLAAKAVGREIVETPAVRERLLKAAMPLRVTTPEGEVFKTISKARYKIIRDEATAQAYPILSGPGTPEEKLATVYAMRDEMMADKSLRAQAAFPRGKKARKGAVARQSFRRYSGKEIDALIDYWDRLGQDIESMTPEARAEALKPALTQEQVDQYIAARPGLFGGPQAPVIGKQIARPMPPPPPAEDLLRKPTQIDMLGEYGGGGAAGPPGQRLIEPEPLLARAARQAEIARGQGEMMPPAAKPPSPIAAKAAEPPGPIAAEVALTGPARYRQHLKDKIGELDALGATDAAYSWVVDPRYTRFQRKPTETWRDFAVRVAGSKVPKPPGPIVSPVPTAAEVPLAPAPAVKPNLDTALRELERLEAAAQQPYPAKRLTPEQMALLDLAQGRPVRPEGQVAIAKVLAEHPELAPAARAGAAAPPAAKPPSPIAAEVAEARSSMVAGSPEVTDAYDALQQQINDVVDDLVKGGMTIEEAFKTSAVVRLAAQRDAIGVDLINGVIRGVKQRVPEIDPQTVEKMLHYIYHIDTSPIGMAMGSKYVKDSFTVAGAKTAKSEVAQALAKKWATEHGLDVEGIWGPASGYTRLGQYELRQGFANQAEQFHQAVADSLTSAVPTETRRGVPLLEPPKPPSPIAAKAAEVAPPRAAEPLPPPAVAEAAQAPVGPTITEAPPSVAAPPPVKPRQETENVARIAKATEAEPLVVEAAWRDFARAADPSGAPPVKGPPPSPPAGGTPDDIFETIRLQATRGEKLSETLLRRHAAAINTAENEARIVMDEATRRLRASGLGEIRLGRWIPRQQDVPVMDELFNALHNPSKVARGEVKIPPGLEGEYARLRTLTDWEESMRLDFDPEMATVQDYFYRGWLMPKEGARGVPRGRLGQTPSFKKPRVDATYQEMRDLGFEPISWNPYEQWRISRLQGVRYRQQMQLIEHLKKLELTTTDASGLAAEGWRTPKVGPAFEGKIFATTDATGKPVAMYSRRWVVPDDLAGSLESMYGVAPNLSNVHVGGHTVELAKAIDAIVFVPKRFKLFGSLFQQIDFLERSYVGAWAGMVDALAAGKPVDAVLSLARWPKSAWTIIESNFSPGARENIRRQLNSTTPLIKGRPGVHPRGIMEAGLSTIDTTILPGDLDKVARSVAEEAGLLGHKAVIRAIGSIESSMRRSLFEGPYPAAQLTDIRNNIAPFVARHYGSLSDEALNGMIARIANKKYSTIPASQSVIQNRPMREILRRIFFSIGETEGLMRQATGAIRGPEAAYWRTHWIGAYLGLIAFANVIHFASTGKPLPLDRWSPISKDKWGLLPMGYNRKFASPDLPIKGKEGLNVTLDVVGQLDTAFRILDPFSFLSARESVPIRAAVTQTTGRDYFNRPIDTVGPGGIYSRTANLANDLFAPIGIGQSAVQIGLQTGGVPKGLVPMSEKGLGTGPQLIQATGLNLRAQYLSELIEKLPDMKRLGIRFGEVGNTIEGVELTPGQRAVYQRVAGKATLLILQRVQADPEYKGWSDADKERVIRYAIDKARAGIRAYMLKWYPEILEKKREALEAAGVR